MKTRLSSLLIAVVLLVGLVFTAVPFASAFDTKVKVEPQLSEFWADTTFVGDTFDISIIAEAVTGFYGWEFVLSWTPGVIDCVSETVNLDIWPYYGGPWVTIPIDNVNGEYHQALTGQAPSTPVDGTFWLVNLTFQIVQAPPYGGSVSTALNVGIAPGYTAYILLDQASGEIPHDYIQGLYIYHWVQPPPTHRLVVDPPSYTATAVGEEFDINVNIEDVLTGWELAGVQFVLTYDASLLDVLSITQGDFFEPFTTATFFWGGTYNSVVYGSYVVRVAYTILDIAHMTTPMGDGLIATIRFNATAQGDYPDILSCDLLLEIDVEAGMGSYFVDKYSDEIPNWGTIGDGFYQILPKVTGRVVDLYTCSYQYPFNGEGPGMPSDMFWPQKEVELQAFVSYNEWPEQNKLVSFEVRDPAGALVTILTALTDTGGVATTSFRIPWPCDDPDSLFGVWTVTATVDIACVVVNDTMQFHFDYLVQWVSVTIDKQEYAHCEDVKITVEFKSHSQQVRPVFVIVAIHDELNYPVATLILPTQVGGAVFCQYAYYSVNATVHVEKFWRAGTGTLHVSALSNLPTMGGSAWTPETTIPIMILATWV